MREYCSGQPRAGRGCMPASWNVCACAHVDARGRQQGLPLLLTALLSVMRYLTETGAHCWPVGRQDLPVCPCAPALGLQALPCMAFYTDTGDQNSGSHTYITSTLPLP